MRCGGGRLAAELERGGPERVEDVEHRDARGERLDLPRAPLAKKKKEKKKEKTCRGRNALTLRRNQGYENA